LNAINDTGSGAVAITNTDDATGNTNTYIAVAPDQFAIFSNVTTGAANQHAWRFDNTGNFVLPGNTFSVNYANGDQVQLGGGGANTGNVTFSDQIVIGTGTDDGSGGLYLATGPNGSANLQYLRVRGGDFPTHIHLDTGNNAYYDQYFGNDSKYLKLNAGDTGNIVIGTDDGNGNLYSWTYNSAGNLTVPGNIQTITTGFPFTSNITDITTGNATVIVTIANNVFPGSVTGRVTISGVVGTIEANGTWYFGNTEVDIFQLYNDEALTSPVDGTTWTAYVSGGLAVAQGYSNISITGGNVQVITNSGNIWTFDSTGNLTLPGNLVITGNTNIFGTDTALIQSNDNIPISLLSSGANGSIASIWVEDIGNVISSNIAAVYANPIPGSGIVRIAVGQNGSPGPNIWDFNTTGNLILPTLSLGTGLDEQTVVQSQRKIIPPFRWSAVIDGATPTVVYTAANPQTTSMKVTVQVQHQGFSMEFFDVSATKAGADTYYTVSNRVAPPTIAASTVVVDLNGSTMQITVTVNSGAATSWVTYDAVEFGIPND